MRLQKSWLATAVAVGITSCSGGSLPQGPVQPGYVAPSVIQPMGSSFVSRSKVDGVVSAAESGTLSVNGVITRVNPKSFILRLAGVDCGGGYFDVYLTSSTTRSGLKPSLGYLVVAAGRGSCSSSMTASSVTISAASPITVSGIVSGKFARGFTVDTTPCRHIHVYVSSSTIGKIPSIGSDATVQGNGACTTYINASSIPSSGVLTVNGVITKLSSKSLTLRLAGVGCGGGYFDAVLPSSTTYTGLRPSLGYQAVATGTGSCSSSMTASSVIISAAQAITVSGPVSAKFTDGFTIDSRSCGYLHVYVSSSTGGSIPAVGANATVQGKGACTTYVTASSVSSTSAAPSSMRHVLTADYLGAPYGTTSIAWSAAAPYLTWAQTAWGSSKAIAATGIKTQLYADPNDTVAGVGDPLYTSDESTFAHDCNGNRVTDVYAGNITQYLMAIGSPAMQTLFANYVNHVVGYGSHFDAIYEDGAGPLSEKIYTPFSAMPCNYSDSEWLAYGEELNQVSSVPIIFNGLDAFKGHAPSMTLGLLQSSNTIGGNFEDCYSDDTQPVMIGWQWQTMEQTELDVAAQNKLFECQLRDGSAASSSMQARIYGLASFLLTYNPLTSILWEEFATNSRFHVLPESGLVPLSPTAPTPSTIAELRQSGGTYARQFGKCYFRGSYVGSCAVVVNSSSSSQQFPYTTYHHRLVISGGGVLDGGTAATDGAAPPTTLGPGQAAVVFP